MKSGVPSQVDFSKHFSEVGSSSIPNGAVPSWLWPLFGTAASLAFATALSFSLRILKGLAEAKNSELRPPQAVLLLGGDRRRERLGALFAAHHQRTKSPTTTSQSSSPSDSTTFPEVPQLPPPQPFSQNDLSFIPPPLHLEAARNLPIFISSAHDDVASVMKSAGVPPGRIHVSNAAMDTVTNFTASLATLQQRGVRHVVLLTSDYHMQRAAMLAAIVFRTHGLAVTAVALPSKQSGVRKGQAKAATSKTSGFSEERVKAEVEGGQEGDHPTKEEDENAAKTVGKGGFGSFDETERDALRRRDGEERVEDEEEQGEVEAETWLRRERDRVRALLWLVTGFTGVELMRFTRPERYRLHKQKPLEPSIS